MISGFKEKLGFWSKETLLQWKSKSDWIWFHAVSVGELNAIWPLVLEIEERTKKPIMISCTTSSGYSLAKKLTSEKETPVFYFPFDIPLVINKLFKKVKISTLIIAETEIWPFIIKKCKKANIKVFIVNARLSNKSFNNYLKFKFFFKPILNETTKIITQSREDTEKFIELGTEKSKIKTLGNLKFTATTQPNNNQVAIGDTKTTKIIFASTHPGEDEIAIKALKQLEHNKDIRLIIAPRHIERTEKIQQLIKENGFTPKLRSKNEEVSSNKDIFILNTIGELTDYFKISKVSVVCGSFANIGGHNILEPIREGSLTFIGPYDHKTKDLTSMFIKHNALIKVDNENELIKKITDYLNNESSYDEIIRNGQALIKKNGKNLENTAAEIISAI